MILLSKNYHEENIDVAYHDFNACIEFTSSGKGRRNYL